MVNDPITSLLRCYETATIVTGAQPRRNQPCRQKTYWTNREKTPTTIWLRSWTDQCYDRWTWLRRGYATKTLKGEGRSPNNYFILGSWQCWCPHLSNSTPSFTCSTQDPITLMTSPGWPFKDKAPNEPRKTLNGSWNCPLKKNSCFSKSPKNVCLWQRLVAADTCVQGDKEEVRWPYCTARKSAEGGEGQIKHRTVFFRQPGFFKSWCFFYFTLLIFCSLYLACFALKDPWDPTLRTGNSGKVCW